MAKKTPKVLWTATSVAASTDWFTTDVSVGGSGPVKHTIQYSVNSAVSIVNIIMTVGGVAKTLGLNGGVSVAVDAMLRESYIVVPGTTYNVQHIDGGARLVSAIVTEDEDDLNIS